MTLLEVCPPTTSDEQGVSSEGHAVVIQDEGDTAWGVARAGPCLQGLVGRESAESQQDARGSVLMLKPDPRSPHPTPGSHLDNLFFVKKLS